MINDKHQFEINANPRPESLIDRDVGLSGYLILAFVIIAGFGLCFPRAIYNPEVIVLDILLLVSAVLLTCSYYAKGVVSLRIKIDPYGLTQTLQPSLVPNRWEVLSRVSLALLIIWCAISMFRLSDSVGLFVSRSSLIVVPMMFIWLAKAAVHKHSIPSSLFPTRTFAWAALASVCLKVIDEQYVLVAYERRTYDNLRVVDAVLDVTSEEANGIQAILSKNPHVTDNPRAGEPSFFIIMTGRLGRMIHRVMARR